MDLYLKSNTESAMNSALISSSLLRELEGQYMPSIGTSIDIIGEIPETTGWHVNVRTAGLTEEQQTVLQPFIVTPPETPYRVWA